MSSVGMVAPSSNAEYVLAAIIHNCIALCAERSCPPNCLNWPSRISARRSLLASRVAAKKRNYDTPSAAAGVGNLVQSRWERGNVGVRGSFWCHKDIH
jgi:hypothetical protein